MIIQSGIRRYYLMTFIGLNKSLESECAAVSLALANFAVGFSTAHEYQCSQQQKPVLVSLRLDTPFIKRR